MRLFFTLGPWASLFTSLSLGAAEICSRMAIINFQEVLIDTSSTEKGEGLRHYLEKDPQAKRYFNIYQKGTKTKWHSAVWGTAGTTFLLAGLISSDRENRKTLLISGAILTTINFFVTRTLEHANESYLIKAIKEYNKRNFPKIYLNAERGDSTAKTFANISIGLDQSWSF